jgi:uncharacterized protein (TIGR03435 family)
MNDRRNFKIRAGVSALIVFGIAAASPFHAQSPSQGTAASPPDYKFEVASIKPTKSTALVVGGSAPDDGYIRTNIPLIEFIREAYGLLPEPEEDDGRISGAPNWLEKEKYDIEARMDSSVADALKKLSPPDRRIARQHMLQALLADRFNLIIHREYKDVPVYMLVVAKNGSKLHEAKPGDTYANGIKSPDGTLGGPGRLIFGVVRGQGQVTGQGVTLARFVVALTDELGRPVLDKTGLTGIYDIALKWNQDDDSHQESGGPSLFTAIQEQLGLKVESGKGPIEIIVIDHIERPSGN